jgi:hypothetical protein
MRKLGCFTVIVLLGVGAYFLLSTQGMTSEQKAQYVGEKAHRGWQEINKMAGQAKQGWDKAPPGAQSQSATP